MDKEKEIEGMAKAMCKGCSMIECKPDEHCYVYSPAERAVNAGYGNVKQAVKEFAEKFKQKVKRVSDNGFTGKTEKQLYQRRGMEEGLQMAIEIVDDLILELYGEKKT